MEGRVSSHREALLADLFEDADRVLDRMEALKNGFGEKFDEANRVVGDAARHAGAALERASAGERELWSREARAVTRDLTMLAHTVAKRSRSLIGLLVAVGLGSGVAGGVVVAIALRL